MESGRELKKGCRITFSCCQFTRWYPGSVTGLLMHRISVFLISRILLLVLRITLSFESVISCSNVPVFVRVAAEKAHRH